MEHKHKIVIWIGKTLEWLYSLKTKRGGMYYTPKEICKLSTGTGSFIKVAADMLSNPPYSAEHSVNPTETTGR